jgi:predicted DNA-binding WGR domain protein
MPYEAAEFERREAASPHRFYRIILHYTTRGSATLIVRYGQVGRPSVCRVQQGQTYQHASEVFDRLYCAARRRGYEDIRHTSMSAPLSKSGAVTPAFIEREYIRHWCQQENVYFPPASPDDAVWVIRRNLGAMACTRRVATIALEAISTGPHLIDQDRDLVLATQQRGVYHALELATYSPEHTPELLALVLSMYTPSHPSPEEIFPAAARLLDAR